MIHGKISTDTQVYHVYRDPEDRERVERAAIAIMAGLIANGGVVAHFKESGGASSALYAFELSRIALLNAETLLCMIDEGAR